MVSATQDNLNFARGSSRARIYFSSRKATDPGSACEFFVNMTNLQIKGSWNEVKGKLKQKYGQATDNDLTFCRRERGRTVLDVFNKNLGNRKKISEKKSRVCKSESPSHVGRKDSKAQPKDKRILCRQNQRNSKWPRVQRWRPREAKARSLLSEVRPKACMNR